MNWTAIIIKLVPSFFSVVIAWITYKQVTKTSETDRNSDELAELKKKIDSLEDETKKLQTKNKLLRLQIESLEQDNEIKKEKIIQYKKIILELRKRLSEYE